MSIPVGWAEATLADVAGEGQYGWTTRASSKKSGYRFLRTTDISPGRIDWEAVPYCASIPDDPNKYALAPGDIVISRAGSIGLSALVTECPSSVFASYLVRFRTRTPLEPRFLAYFLKSSLYWTQIRQRAAGIALQNVNARKLSTITVPVAPRNEQVRIVSKIEELFSDLDAGVAALERAKANLARYRAAVLKAAVEGRLTAEWRMKQTDVEPASKLLARILADRRRKWEEAELAKSAAAGKTPLKNWREGHKEPTSPELGHLPQLPNGWCWTSFDQCAWEITVGHVGPMKEEYCGDGLPFLRSQNVRPLRFDREGIKRIPPTFDRRLSKSRLFGGELLVVRSGVNFGDCCVYPIGEPQGNCADLVITRLLSGVTPAFAAIFIASPLGQVFVGGRRTGSAQPHFNVGSMRTSPFPLPPEEEQRAIVEEVSRRLSILEECRLETRRTGSKVANLRQGILRHAFEGKLVPQDPNDEPASRLLERIKAEHTDSLSNQGRQASRKRTAKDTV